MLCLMIIIQTGNIKSTCWFYYIKRNTYTDRDPQEFYGYGVGTKGYTYFEDGINSAFSTSKLFSNTYIYLPENQSIKIPIYVGPGGVKFVRFFTKDGAGNESIAETKVLHYLQMHLHQRIVILLYNTLHQVFKQVK